MSAGVSASSHGSSVAGVEIAGASAMVTGGASGLGEATALRLAERGARIVVVDLPHQEEKTKGLLASTGGVFVPTDVTDEAQVIAAVEAAMELGPLRVLVNCAGIGWAQRTIGKDGQYGSAHGLDIFTKVVQINLIGTFNCIRLAATAMSQTEPQGDGERGAIVNTASVAASDGQIGQAAYAASKGAVVGMTLPIARDLAAVGIRVNTILPGFIDTPIYGIGEAAEGFKAKLTPSLLFPKRFGSADEFASLAVELVTNSYMNAESVRCDGGVRMPPK